MKYITLTTPGGSKVYLFPHEGIVVQGNPESKNHTMISIYGSEHSVREPLNDVIAALANLT